MNDLISRQKAIEIIKNYCENGCDYAEDNWCPSCQRKKFVELLKALPSAQPDLDEWCTDCSEYDQERHCCPRWNRVIRQTLKDAQPERKKGKWILHIDDLFPEESTMECNQCHEHQPVTIDDNFCPNCGADMRGEEE